MRELMIVFSVLVVFAIALSATSGGGNMSMNEHRQRGWFRVLYRDGQVSQPFKFKTALDYCDMFGGRVVLRNGKRAREAMKGLQNP
jgi:hypothetical protein